MRFRPRSSPGWSMRSPTGTRSRRADARGRLSGQFVEAFAEALEAHREADALLRRLEDDEGRGLPGTQLLDQILVHDHFGDAAVRQATHKAGASDVGLIDLEPEARG